MRRYNGFFLGLALVSTVPVVLAEPTTTHRLSISGRVVAAPCQSVIEHQQLRSTCHQPQGISQQQLDLTRLSPGEQRRLDFAMIEQRWIDSTHTLAKVLINHY